jgi:hypothetical protein
LYKADELVFLWSWLCSHDSRTQLSPAKEPLSVSHPLCVYIPPVSRSKKWAAVDKEKLGLGRRQACLKTRCTLRSRRAMVTGSPGACTARGVEGGVDRWSMLDPGP